MHAIVFDMLISDLKTHYGERYHRAYSEISKIMEDNGFEWIQGNTYVTEKSLIAVTQAMNALNKIDWFRQSVRDIRAFKIVDWSDFTPMFTEKKLISKFKRVHTFLANTFPRYFPQSILWTSLVRQVHILFLERLLFRVRFSPFGNT